MLPSYPSSQPTKTAQIPRSLPSFQLRGPKTTAIKALSKMVYYISQDEVNSGKKIPGFPGIFDVAKYLL